MKKLAYFSNTYPIPSTSFIRREVAALERRGATIARFTVRAWVGPLADPGDEAERARTRAILDVGPLGLLGATIGAAFARPARLLSALRLALRSAKASDRGVAVHLVYLAEACVLRRWLAESGVEHLHAHFGTNSATVAMLVRALGGPPYSFTVHGPDEFDQPRALSLGEKIRRCAFVVGVSGLRPEPALSLGRLRRLAQGEGRPLRRRRRLPRLGADLAAAGAPPGLRRAAGRAEGPAPAPAGRRGLARRGSGLRAGPRRRRPDARRARGPDRASPPRRGRPDRGLDEQR